MPNWCLNSLTIKGPKEKVKSLYDEIMEKNQFLSILVPEPDYKVTLVPKAYPETSAYFAKTDEEREEIMENKPTIRDDSWWDWRVINWGTKWDISPDNLENFHYFEEGDIGSIEAGYDSAWGPPSQALMTYWENNQDLNIRNSFYEEGCAFVGISENDDYDEFEIPQDWREVEGNIPADLIEEWEIIENLRMWDDEEE